MPASRLIANPLTALAALSAITAFLTAGAASPLMALAQEQPSRPNGEQTGETADDPAQSGTGEEAAIPEPDEETGQSRSRYDILQSEAFPLPLAPQAASRIAEVETMTAAHAAHTLQIIEIPLTRLPVDITQKSDNLWVRGNRPEANLLARLELVAKDEVSIQLADGQEVHLFRANREPRYGLSATRTLDLVSDSVLYCGAIPSPSEAGQSDAEQLAVNRMTPICLHDSDNDQSFEKIAPAISELSNDDPRAISLMLPSVDLAEPIAYQNVAVEQQERLALTMRNCDKDWDRPRYQMVIELEGAPEDAIAESLIETMRQQGLLGDLPPGVVAALLGSSRGPSRITTRCKAGKPLEQFEGRDGDEYGRGHILVNLDGLAFSVGRKKDGAPVQLLGEVANVANYRLESRSLAFAGTGLSADQKKLATRQRFDRPPFIATGPIAVAPAEIQEEHGLFSLPFEYGYRARLTENTRIRTLLTSRSLEEGAEFYGIPMQRSRVTTYGYGATSSTPVGHQRDVDVELTWCTPVLRERMRRVDGVVVEQRIHEATCFTQLENQYSIVKGNRPAYGVTSMRHEAQISTNDGRPELELLGAGGFGAPLEMRFFFDSFNEENKMLALRQEIWFDGEKTSESKQWFRPQEDGTYSYRNGGAHVRFSFLEGQAGAIGDIEVVTQVETGASLSLRASPPFSIR